ncbi:MAG TPA: hypothetical protein VMC02_15625 [Steroidobacteraceae bacterium]|nr:hypothetical protein [Steroidobacteraceae bacterium]
MSTRASVYFLAVVAATAAASGQCAVPVQEGTPQPQMTALRYDSDYPVIGYSGPATQNPVARLQARMTAGKVKLDFRAPRGYLDSVLKNLGIDPSSQTLVYSATSLANRWINAATPRAIYFNDDTYVAWVQGSNVLEFVTMDRALGPVFYALSNYSDSGDTFSREILRCLVCHDKFSLKGGGVPLILATSSYVDTAGEQLKSAPLLEVTDQTPIAQRWGGWYVTGQQGRQAHLGNLLIHTTGDLHNIDRMRRGNLQSLARLFDTGPYLTDKSDIVALLVLEHQLTVYNLITRVNFKARTLVARQSIPVGTGPWAGLPPKTQSEVRELVEPLVHAMLFTDAAPLTDKVASGSGFDTWFQARGPRDKAGRSLRDLDLKTRLFRYPLSYLVYSPAFDGLPDYARSYIYGRFADILAGKDPKGAYTNLSADDRAAILAILTDTKPEFAKGLTSRQFAQ